MEQASSEQRQPIVSNRLYYGDNLNFLRDADESVDPIYLGPPFNSKRDYKARAESKMSEQKGLF
jgi:hypothetical protein